MAWDIRSDRATITRRRRIDGRAYDSVTCTVAFMLQEMSREISRLERGHDYNFVLTIERVVQEPAGTPGNATETLPTPPKVPEA